MSFNLGSNTISNVKLGPFQVKEIYLGSNKFWSSVVACPGGNIFIDNWTYTQADLELILTGETITSYVTGSGNSACVFSSTNYIIDVAAFDAYPNLLSYIDEGNCFSIGQSAFSFSSVENVVFPGVTELTLLVFENCGNLQTAVFENLELIDNGVFRNSGLITANYPKVTSVGFEAFALCTSLSTIDLRNCTSWGTNVFLNVPFNGTITVKSGQQTNANITYLVSRGWTVITV